MAGTEMAAVSNAAVMSGNVIRNVPKAGTPPALSEFLVILQELMPEQGQETVNRAPAD
jgi:hypothetical protein